MGWLWWVLVAVVLGGLVWWLVNRSNEEPAADAEVGAGTGRRADGDAGSHVSAGAVAAGATAAGAAGGAVLNREEPAHDEPATETEFTGSDAPSADLDPAAAGIDAPTQAESTTGAPPVTPEATGAAPDDTGWAPAEAPADDTYATADQMAADHAAAEADVETPSDAGAAASAEDPAESATGSTEASADDSGWTSGHQVTESQPVDEAPEAPAAAGPAGASSQSAWAQDQADVTADGETPVVSEASGAAAEDVAPAEAPAAHEVESGSTDIEFADASVAYQEPVGDPSYAPTHLAPGDTQAPDTSVPSAQDTSVDPAASPEATPAPETGAGEGFGGAAIGGTAEVSEGRYGPGSAEPSADGSAPGAAYTVKGNVESMRFHGPESPYYNRTTAEVWFTDADTARAAGFIPWNEI